jgi:predicted dehydrogenase
MNVGILGFAHSHAAGYATRLNALPNAHLVAAYDADPDRLANAVRDFGGTPYSDPGDLLARDDLDAVLVFAETSRHAELVIAAAHAGKHVLCEKPLATTLSDANRMVEACQQAGVRLGTIFPMRFNASIASLRTAIAAGAVGTPLAVNSTNNGQMPPGWFRDPSLAGGGAVMDHVVHCADLLRWVFATEITEVYAEVDTAFTPGLPVDDVGVLMLRLANGMTASIDASWNRSKSWPTWGGLTFEVVGSDGVLAANAFAEQLRLASDAAARYSYVSWGEDPDLKLLNSFIAAIEQGAEIPVSGVDGVRALEAALAAYESSRTARPVSTSSLA